MFVRSPRAFATLGFRGLILAILLQGIALLAAVDPTWDYAVMVSAAVQSSPAKITLSWPQDSTLIPQSYVVYRKAPSATSWTSVATLSGTTLTYADTNVTAGTAYEYQVIKNTPSYKGYGYVRSGIGISAVENRGTVLLLVDATMATPLASELNQFKMDLVGDGWTVKRFDVSRTASVTQVKQVILSAYQADPSNVKSLILFGHIPVPRSGILQTDTHIEHRGAWAADPYYADMTGTWTDTTANYYQTTNGSAVDRDRLTNIPGDGKFDQKVLPAPLDLEMGRVDLANMPGRVTEGGAPSFPSEVELLRNYLRKDHAFRQAQLVVQRRGIVADYFGFYGGYSFATNGYRNFSAFFGASKVVNLNALYGEKTGVWLDTLKTDDYLFAYGCGPGGYTFAHGLGHTADYFGLTKEIYDNDIKTVFVLLNGSWFGDWDAEDDLLRGVLATPSYGLASAWAGNPHWFVHPMAMGETIGFCTKLTQNNTTLYKNQVNNEPNQIHTALMGDPTLRMHPVLPPSGGSTRVAASSVTVSWSASSDASAGYFVYRSGSIDGPYVKVSSSAVSGTSYSDTTNTAKQAYYMVRAQKFETSGSGTYYNLSQGHFITVAAPDFITHPMSQTVAPGGSVTFSGEAVSATSYQWRFNGTNISGATSSTLTLNNLTSANEGTYTLVATNFQGSTSSLSATLRVATPTSGRLINLSSRGLAGNDARVMVAGFVVSSSTNKSVLIRGVGPALGLAPFNIPGSLANPVLSLYRGATLIATNDNWQDNNQGATISQQNAALGAFGLPDKSLDSALFSTISGSTNYTAQVSSKTASEGLVITEIYDATPADAGTPVILNLSTRAPVGSGINALVSGFVLSGNTPHRLLIRGVGPTLSAFNLSGLLADPYLELHGTVNNADTILAFNDNWMAVPEIETKLRDAFSKAGAFALPAGSLDSALDITLMPGTYTVVMKGVGNSTGIALMEIYDLTAIP